MRYSSEYQEFLDWFGDVFGKERIQGLSLNEDLLVRDMLWKGWQTMRQSGETIND